VVPEPYTHSGDAILMEYVGTAEGAAPLLLHAQLTSAEARGALDGLLESIEIFLACDRVHGDLSAYNVLWDGARACVIDCPQAVDARTSPHAYQLLQRDVRNLCGFFARLGVECDASRFTHDLWQRYQRGQL
jgi:RIO kinase 1